MATLSVGEAILYEFSKDLQYIGSTVSPHQPIPWGLSGVQSRFLLFGQSQLPPNIPSPLTLWSVSRLQIVTEVEDINSEGSYGGEGRGRKERENI